MFVKNQLFILNNCQNLNPPATCCGYKQMLYYTLDPIKINIMNKLDLIILIILGFYMISGLRKGFLRTLLGPVALIIGTILAVVYYQQTENFLWALLISVLAPLVVNLLLLIALKLLHKTLGQKEGLSSLSRAAGAALAAVWSGTWIILTLIFLVITPCEWSWFDKLQDNVLKSKTYALINMIVGDKIPNTSMNVHELSEMLQNPRKFRILRETDEYKDLAESQTVLELLEDADTMEQIEHQDLPKLLSNPKFQALLQDKELIEKIFALNQKLNEMQDEGEPEPQTLEQQNLE